MSKANLEGGCEGRYPEWMVGGGRPGAHKAVRNFILKCALGILFVAGPTPLFSADLVDTSLLGVRGAILQTAGQGFFAVADAQGIGDFNGDGLDDIVLAVR